MPVPQGVRDLVKKKIARPEEQKPKPADGKPVPSPSAKPVPNTMPKMPATDPRIPPSTGVVPEGFADDLRRLQQGRPKTSKRPNLPPGRPDWSNEIPRGQETKEELDRLQGRQRGMMMYVNPNAKPPRFGKA